MFLFPTKTPDPFTSNLYGLCSFLMLQFARPVYRSYTRSYVGWSEITSLSLGNALVRAHASGESPGDALPVYIAIRKNGITPNEYTIPFSLKSCGRVSALEFGRGIHGEVLKFGLGGIAYVGNALVSFYGSCKRIQESCKLFDEMPVRTVVSWNAILTACVENSWVDCGLGYFMRMRECGFEPDETTMVVLLSACVEMGSLGLGRWVHSRVIGEGMVLNCQLGTALVDMYAKCGDLRSASLVFDQMEVRNVWTWSAMILSLAQHGSALEALRLFANMQATTKIRPNYVTFLGVLCACSHSGLVDEGYKYFRDMNIYGIEPMNIHYGAMVDVLARAGRIREARDFILQMPIEPDPVLWRTLLGACSLHDKEGKTGVGDEVRRRLLELEPRRGGNLVMVANMFAETGMWDAAEKVRKAMKRKGLKKVGGESTIEINGSMNRFYSGDDCRVDCEDIYLLIDELSFHMKMYNVL